MKAYVKETEGNVMLVGEPIKYNGSTVDAIKRDTWFYTPDEIYGSGGKEHNIFQYDERIIYEMAFAHKPLFYPIIAQTEDKIPGIPLVREESLRVKDRYQLMQVDSDGSKYIFDNEKDWIAIDMSLIDDNVSMRVLNALNRQSGDIEALAEKEYPGLEQLEIGDPELFAHKSWLIAHQQTAFIAGYKAAGQYSRDDMQKAFNTGRNYQLTGENNFKELLDSIRKPTYKEFVEIEENDGKPVVDEEGYVKVI